MTEDSKSKTITQYLGELIEQRRKDLRMTQEYLSAEAGISRSYLSDIERGLRNISVGTLVRISRALETNASDFLRIVESALTAQLVTPDD